MNDFANLSIDEHYEEDIWRGTKEEQMCVSEDRIAKELNEKEGQGWVYSRMNPGNYPYVYAFYNLQTNSGFMTVAMGNPMDVRMQELKRLTDWMSKSPDARAVI